MTVEEAVTLFRDEIALLEASGTPFEPARWSLVTCACTQAEGMLVAVALGIRLAFAPGAFPCGSFMLCELPEDAC